ncbi:restriction endonuclease subunit S [Flavobacterium myungsuense]|uniref:Restriction endonuclease subunit S n=1 Tax=Flavobacterium myungsuense TaxID=651823 RepID=A0ABW3J2T3_9FLAO
MSWIQISIGDIGKVITGNTPPKSNPEFYGNDYKFIKPTDMEIGQRYTPITEDYYSELAYKKYINSLIPPLSTCVVTIGSIGKKITLTNDFSFINQAVNAVIPDEKKYDPFFVFYALKNILHKVKSADTGASSGRENVSKSNFMTLKLEVPIDIETQKKIGSVLSSFDDLIENNLKRIKLLEETAQNIYKEWFVNFRFANYEHTAFDVESGLPVGWSVDIIGNQLLTIKRNGKLKTDDYELEGKFPIIDQANGFIAGYTNNEEVVQDLHLPIVVFGDHTRRVKFVNFPFVSGADGTQLMFPKNENLLPAYFYLSINNIDLSNYAYARHYKFMKEQPIIIPDEKTLDEFNKKAYPLLEQTIHLLNYNQKLKEARDILLPRLMNRTIDV